MSLGVFDATGEKLGALPAFDLTAPLARGVTVLEASAGTGKTYALAALVARFVADGVTLEQLLTVTFTRVATGELRERVRERLIASEAALADALDGSPPGADDPVSALLARGETHVLEQRRARLAAALASFDAATIETIHGFCQRVLDSLGVLADNDPHASFAEDTSELVAEVVDDLYLRRFYRRAGEPALSRDQALAIATLAISNPTAAVHPPQDAADAADAMRARLAHASRSEYEARKRRLGIITHEDQLTRLVRTLSGPSGDVAVARLRRRYRAVLIDEFQDTDPLQWEIVRRAFAGGQTSLVLIGDPKQAIYAFRGADVYAYLQAAASASHRATLNVNRRSDRMLLDGLDALFGNARLGHPQIIYRHVSAAPGHDRSRLRDAPHPAALRLRLLGEDQPAVIRTSTGFARTDSARAFIARDLAADIAALIGAGAEIEQRAPDGAVTGVRPVSCSDVAVLVRAHFQARLVRDALQELGVPAVIGGAGSVFASDAARDWETLLAALEHPSERSRVNLAALTPFIGLSGSQVALADETQLAALRARLHTWARLLRERGIAALTSHILSSERVAARVLRAVDGQRRLTDIGHVAELMHAAASGGRLGPAALADWLRERIDAADRERGDEALTRRLDSDADAVQVLTFHRSKGLEFAFVYCPYLWDARVVQDQGEPFAFHDPQSGDQRAIDVSLSGAQRSAHLQQHLLEERGEELRLMYVALTRARQQAVLWWASSWHAKDSALGRLLFTRDAQGNVAACGDARLHEAEVKRRLDQIVALAPHAVAVEEADLRRRPPRARTLAAAAGELRIATFDRTLDTRWRRTSFTAITAGVERVPEGALQQSAPDQADQSAVGQPQESAVGALPLAAMAAGPQLGTLIHRVLQLTDFRARDLTGTLAAKLRAQGGRVGALLGCAPEQVAAGLATALQTPLGGSLGELRLAQVPTSDRLDELSFDLPLAGGSTPAGHVTLADLAALLRRRLRPTDPLAAYAEQLTDRGLEGELRGYLTGVIDLVLRTRTADGRTHYSVIDYKTNRLADAGEPLRASDYRPELLAEEMRRSHYALQALLYSVALHRYLRWRARGYDPELDLAGIHYLFLRGMLGAAHPASGVFAWHPPAQLITELSDLLDGRAVSG